MFRKSFLFIILSMIAAVAIPMTAHAQMAPLNGLVLFDKDGKTAPVAGALVEVYRIEVKGYYSAKTDKKGEFRFAGILFGDYVIAVSAPNCSPTLFPNVKAGQEGIKITLDPGDGSKFTEAEAKKGGTAKSGSGSSELSEEEKKEKAEIDKKNAEIMANNDKIKNADAVVRKSSSEGLLALKAAGEATNNQEKNKNYDLALAKFNEGIAAVPDFVDSTPFMLNGKIEAFKGKGFLLYAEGAASTDRDTRRVKWDEANKLYDEGLAAFKQAMAIFKSSEPTNDLGTQKMRETRTLTLYTIAVEIHRLKGVTGVDGSKADEANTVINEYIAIEPDPAKKINAQMVIGSIMVKTGDFAKAVETYRQIIAVKPDHAEANGQLGLALFGLATMTVPENKEMEQEGLNFMQKYIEMSPVSPTDPPLVRELKESIKAIVDDLKSQKMTPQKVPAAPKKKN